MKRISIFASGSGTNADNICKYFENSDSIEVALIVTNNPEAGVIYRAKKWEKPYLILRKDDLTENEGNLSEALASNNIDLIVLAGFLKKIPSWLIKLYQNKIINLHPSLLPKYGGKGMYGNRVHKTVLRAGEKETGITFHFVNEEYDEGKIILQKSFAIEDEETLDSLVDKIHQLEYKYYPEVIENILKKKQESQNT